MALTDDLICAKKTSRAWQFERACSLAAGRAGVDVIMRITRPGAEGEFWSWLERRFHVAIVTAYDLPIPQYNVPLRDTEGLIGYADVCWELARSVVVELDGLRFHRLTKARGKDSRKANRYALSGRIPLRFTYQTSSGTLNRWPGRSRPRSSRPARRLRRPTHRRWVGLHRAVGRRTHRAGAQPSTPQGCGVRPHLGG